MSSITFLGSGSAFNTKDMQSNILVEINGKNLLVDCGTFFPLMLEASDYGLKDIDAYYVSHLHADHIGGLEFVAFNTFFNPDLDKPLLIGNHILLKELWKNSLSGGLDSVQNKLVNMSSFFKLKRVKNNGSFVFEGVKFQLVQVVHVSGGFSFMASYGLIFTLNGTKIFITTDTQFAPNQLHDYYSSVDIVFQDCETVPFAFKSGVHAHYLELGHLEKEVKKKMHLYHYNPGDKPDCLVDGFRGWVQRNKKYTF